VSSRDFAIEAVRHVIYVDKPHDMDKYVHQIGRRNSISFFDPTSKSDRKLARPLVRLLTKAQQEVPQWLNEVGKENYL